MVESCFGRNPHTTANTEPEILFFLFPVQSSGSVKQKFAQDLLSNKTNVFLLGYDVILNYRTLAQGILRGVKYLLAFSTFDQTTNTSEFSLECQIIKGFEEDLFNS